MALTKKQKEQLIEQYKKKIAESKALYVVEPNKISVNQTTTLKKRLYDLNSSFNVVKNTLLTIALEQSGMEAPEEIKAGQKAVLFSSDQISESAKVLKEFLSEKENKETLNILLGFLDKEVITSRQIKDLADLPSREVMLAQVLGTMEAPIAGFVRVLNGNIQNIVTVISEIQKQKEESK